ncbi:MAG: hypothetical protein N5P05_000498 [Chroococcopsis gigantea SAG 12.99]|jgi:hypothetical protein|nr:hypothetical protein [Chlorogloea purpurea SAG 13.99]MDV2998892.1 hypothetical protein [Chroococcopsis gigantea SAG 12.99]
MNNSVAIPLSAVASTIVTVGSVVSITSPMITTLNQSENRLTKIESKIEIVNDLQARVHQLEIGCYTKDGKLYGFDDPK